MRVYLARINEDVISRLDSPTLKWLKMKKLMAMFILAKSKWINKIKKQTSDKQSRLLHVEILGNAAKLVFKLI